MDLDLDDVDPMESILIGPIDPDRGTGHKYADFSVGDAVEVWQARSWWHGKITYKSNLYETLTIRFVGAKDATSHILPKNARPAI